jgi:hypothetical protein
MASSSSSSDSSFVTVDTIRGRKICGIVTSNLNLVKCIKDIQADKLRFAWTSDDLFDLSGLSVGAGEVSVDTFVRGMIAVCEDASRIATNKRLLEAFNAKFRFLISTLIVKTAELERAWGICNEVIKECPGVHIPSIIRLWIAEDIGGDDSPIVLHYADLDQLLLWHHREGLQYIIRLVEQNKVVLFPEYRPSIKSQLLAVRDLIGRIDDCRIFGLDISRLVERERLETARVCVSDTCEKLTDFLNCKQAATCFPELLASATHLVTLAKQSAAVTLFPIPVEKK